MGRVLVASLALVGVFGATGSAQAQQAGGIDFTQVTRPVVQVTDSATIDYLLFELFLEPLQTPTRLQIIDVTQNGFGPDDVIVAYPSAEAFLIPGFLPDSVQAIMSGWEPEVEYRMDSGNMPTSALASLIGGETDSGWRAEGALLYDITRAVDRSYRDLPVAILFQRDSIGFTFQLWDYNRSGMHYSPRPDLVPDSAVSVVLAMLEQIGYLPGANTIGTGLSLASQGRALVTVDRALQGMTSLPDEQMRILAAQTVLLGSFDFDRSGAIDRALEIDAPTCAVWNALDNAFPNYLEQFGFEGTGEPYVGDVVFNISVNVRGPAYRRGKACMNGEEPPATDPSEIDEPATQGDLPEAVERFVRLEAAGDILQRAGRLGTSPDQWSAAVGEILAARFDRDGSGSLDTGLEIRSIPCDVWQAMAATHPEFPYGLGFLAGTVYVGDHIGVAPNQRQELLARASGCVQTTRSTAEVEEAPIIPPGLREFLDLLTAARIARSAVGMVPGSVRWATLIQSTLVGHYDLDGSGSLDQTDEVIEVPCPMWATIEATYGAPLSELGLAAEGEYFADKIGIAIEQRLLVAARILACAG